jgi:cell wall-associated NlpC family hydrolase
MSQPSALIAAARRYCGVRFAHQGRTRTGLDCLGLVLLAAADAGYVLHGRPPHAFDDCEYGARPDTARLEATLGAHLQRVERLQLGALLLLRIEGSPQHLALVSDYPASGEWGMIHAYAVARRVVEHRLDAHWQAAIHRIYALPTR